MTKKKDEIEVDDLNFEPEEEKTDEELELETLEVETMIVEPSEEREMPAKGKYYQELLGGK